jgi:hypothetical protein
MDPVLPSKIQTQRVLVVVEALFQPRLKEVRPVHFFLLRILQRRRGLPFFGGLLLFFFLFFMFFPMFIPLTFPEDLADSDTGILTAYILDHNRVHLSQRQAWKISTDIIRQSALLGVPIDLSVAIMERESSFNPMAMNRLSGDYGLFQIHYSFWKQHFARKKGSRLWALSFKDLYQIDVNVRVGMMIIRHDLVLSRGSVSRMIGFYSGRKGKERDQYVMSVLVNESRFRQYQKKSNSLAQLR